MKKYYDCVSIGVNNNPILQDAIKLWINLWQKEGYEVEIHYSCTQNLMTALLLKYKEEE